MMRMDRQAEGLTGAKSMLLLRPRLSRPTAVQMPIRKRESMPLSGFLAGLPSRPLLFGVTRCWPNVRPITAAAHAGCHKIGREGTMVLRSVAPEGDQVSRTCSLLLGPHR